MRTAILKKKIPFLRQTRMWLYTATLQFTITVVNSEKMLWKHAWLTFSTDFNQTVGLLLIQVSFWHAFSLLLSIHFLTLFISLPFSLFWKFFMWLLAWGSGGVDNAEYNGRLLLSAGLAGPSSSLHWWQQPLLGQSPTVFPSILFPLLSEFLRMH